MTLSNLDTKMFLVCHWMDTGMSLCGVGPAWEAEASSWIECWQWRRHFTERSSFTWVHVLEVSEDPPFSPAQPSASAIRSLGTGERWDMKYLSGFYGVKTFGNMLHLHVKEMIQLSITHLQYLPIKTDIEKKLRIRYSNYFFTCLKRWEQSWCDCVCSHNLHRIKQICIMKTQLNGPRVIHQASTLFINDFQSLLSHLRLSASRRMVSSIISHLLW